MKLDAPGVSLKSEFFCYLTANEAVVFHESNVNFHSLSPGKFGELRKDEWRRSRSKKGLI